MSEPETADEALLHAARAARERAYAPYSRFAVGAAIACANGTLVTGTNVENASYGLAICAERAAVCAAIAAGYRRFAAIAVAGPDGADCAPCGACRQVLAEFGGDARVLYTARAGVVATTVAALLPAAFDAANLA